MVPRHDTTGVEKLSPLDAAFLALEQRVTREQIRAVVAAIAGGREMPRASRRHSSSVPPC